MCRYTKTTRQDRVQNKAIARQVAKKDTSYTLIVFFLSYQWMQSVDSMLFNSKNANCWIDWKFKAQTLFPGFPRRYKEKNTYNSTSLQA